MDKKTLLAKATEKLDRKAASPEPAPAIEEAGPPKPAFQEKPPAPPSVSRPKRAEKTPAGPPAREEDDSGVEPVVKKGITLRPSNVKKLEGLELALRNRGLKPSHSGLIQIAIDRLEDGPQLEDECRRLLARDLRFRGAE